MIKTIYSNDQFNSFIHLKLKKTPGHEQFNTMLKPQFPLSIIFCTTEHINCNLNQCV